MSTPKDFIVNLGDKKILFRQPSPSRAMEIFRLIYQPLTEVVAALKSDDDDAVSTQLDYGIKALHYYGYLLYETCEDEKILLPRCERKYAWESNKFKAKSEDEASSLGEHTIDAFIDAGFTYDDIRELGLQIQEKLIEIGSAVEGAEALKKNGLPTEKRQEPPNQNRQQRRALRHTTQPQG